MRLHNPNDNRLWLARRLPLEAWVSCWHAEQQQWHAHAEYQLTFTRHGQGTIAVGDQRYVCGAGVGVLIPTNAVHRLQPVTAGWIFDTLYIPASELPQRNLGAQVFSSASLIASFGSLHRAICEAAAPCQQELAWQALRAQLLQASQESLPTTSVAIPLALTQVRDHLASHVWGECSLDALAQQTGWHACHLNRAFRRAFGLPPHAYHLQLRVNQARELLRSRLPIVTVAAETGFADQAHFTRHFKRLVGVTPGKYLSQIKNVQDALHAVT